MTRLSADGYIVVQSLPQPQRDQVSILLEGHDLMFYIDATDGPCIDIQNLYLILSEAGLPCGGELIN